MISPGERNTITTEDATAESVTTPNPSFKGNDVIIEAAADNPSPTVGSRAADSSTLLGSVLRDTTATNGQGADGIGVAPPDTRGGPHRTGQTSWVLSAYGGVRFGKEIVGYRNTLLPERQPLRDFARSYYTPEGKLLRLTPEWGDVEELTISRVSQVSVGRLVRIGKLSPSVLSLTYTRLEAARVARDRDLGLAANGFGWRESGGTTYSMLGLRLFGDAPLFSDRLLLGIGAGAHYVVAYRNTRQVQLVIPSEDLDFDYREAEETTELPHGRWGYSLTASVGTPVGKRAVLSLDYRHFYFNKESSFHTAGLQFSYYFAK